jgi:hypothetical protein
MSVADKVHPIRPTEQAVFGTSAGLNGRGRIGYLVACCC